MWHDSILEVVGKTPLVRLNRVVRGVRATVLAKLEYLNPGGSVKDRIGITMLEAAEKAGKIKPGGTIRRSMLCARWEPKSSSRQLRLIIMILAATTR